MEELAEEKAEDSNAASQEHVMDSLRNGNLQTVIASSFVAVVHTIRKEDGTILEGSFYNHYSFATFLNEWLLQVKKSMNIATTTVSLTDEDRAALKFDQKTLYHSLITIVGFPPTEFFGCGFGKTLRLSKWAACREVVVRLYCANLVTPIQFNRIGSSDLLSKTAKKKYRTQWSIVKRYLERFENTMSLSDVPNWFLYGPYTGTKRVEPDLIEGVKKVIKNAKDLLQNEEDCSNSEMRRKRKAEDQMEFLTIAGSCDTIIKALPILDDKTSAYSKRRYLLSQDSAEMLTNEETKGNPGKKEEVGQEQLKSVGSNTHGVEGFGTMKNENVSESSDCEIIDGELELGTRRAFISEEKPELIENNTIASDIPSTSKGVIRNDSSTKVNGKLTNPINGLISPPSALSLRLVEQKYLQLCEKLRVSHVPSATYVFELIKQRRLEYPKDFDSFDAHIWNHFEMNAQDDRTFTWKMRVREKLLNVVRRLYPDAKLIAVGSTINGCGAYNSDMDLCMCLPDPHCGYHTDREHGVRVLKKVYRELAYRSRGLVRMATFIPAKVPIIKLEMEAPFDELEVDINCNNVPGIYNSHLLHYYARIDDRFPALCLLVKHWAINAGINDAMTGTFNSYSIILLVLHFLQCAVLPPVLPNLQALFPDQFDGSVDLDNLELFKDLRPLPKREVNTNTVGELLIAFFDYYSHFEFTRNAISVCRGCLIPRSKLPLSHRRYKIYIEEPFDLQNTARCVTRVENLQLIQSAFAEARKAFLGHKSKGPTLASIDVR